MDRKKWIKSAAAVLTMIWCMIQALPVYASGNPSVVLENAGIDMKKRILQVECNMTNMDRVTNGKLRVTYDAGKIKLIENQAGNIISDSDALCEINDCLTGNKEEGEIVFAFASATELPSEGCFANMKFSIDDGVAAQEKVKVSVFVESLAGNEGNVEAENKNLTVTIKNNNQGNDGEDDNPGDSGNQENNERPGITGSGRTGSGGSRKDGSSGNITGSREKSSNVGSSSSRSSIKSKRSDEESDQDSDTSENGNGKESSASDDERRVQVSGDEKVPKAGLNEDDSHWLVIPIVVLVVIFASIVYKKKQKSKVDS